MFLINVLRFPESLILVPDCGPTVGLRDRLSDRVLM